MWGARLRCDCSRSSVLCCVQTLHIVRHGESTYNAASRSGTGFSDPQIFDPVLTEKGRRQVHHLVSFALMLFIALHCYLCSA